ncbi:ATP-binding cassette domain-containing protein [Spirochaetota bacterium]
MKSDTFTISAKSITRRFGNALLFKDLNFSIKTGDSFSLTGPNGSGKTTLLHILTALQRPSSGLVEYKINGEVIPLNEINEFIGFISPNVNPYRELTGIENINFALKKGSDKNKAKGMLDIFNLYQHREKQVKYYSSGMAQRLKFIMAVINNPPIFIFDEPGTNLDKKGKGQIYSYIEENMKSKLILIATNETAESKLCTKGISLDK